MSRDEESAQLQVLFKAKHWKFDKFTAKNHYFRKVSAAVILAEGDKESGEAVDAIEDKETEYKGEFGLLMDSFEAGTSLQGVQSEVQTDDLYNLEVSVAVADTESEEINSEFAEALNEIDGKVSFPCDQCDKICKSKGGLTRHKKSKHCDSAEAASLDETRGALCEDSVKSIVEAIKVKLLEEDLYGNEVSAGLATVSSTVALFNALLSFYNKFCRKKNQDRFLETFYGLIPQSCELLNCQDYKVANLVMIHIPQHLIGFYNASQTALEGSATPETLQLNPAERGPLSYLAGYVVAKLHQENRRKKEDGNHELHALLQNMKCSESNNYISVRSRGGLVTACNDLVKILEVAEVAFREQVH